MRLKEVDKALLIWGFLSREGLGQIRGEGKLVVVPENRPYLVGLRHNIPLLKKDNIPFIYCTDNMLGILFYKEKIKKTLLFYKELRKEGVVGICGSLYIVLLSKLHNVPIEIMPQEAFGFIPQDRDASTLGGKSLILERNRQEFVVRAEDELIQSSILQ